MASNVLIRGATIIGMLALLAPAAALADDGLELAERIGRGNPVAGAAKSKTELCQECHGERGHSSRAEFPKLAGQYADYIAKQLHDFQSGRRRHQLMHALSEALDDNDINDIATYFASSERMQGSVLVDNKTADNETARALFLKGDMKRNIMSCKSCHGSDGKGAFFGSESYPVLAGQHKFYLREQLLNWKSGMRHNSPSGVMNVIAKSLSETEIEALADYIAGL